MAKNPGKQKEASAPLPTGTVLIHLSKKPQGTKALWGELSK
jgi:hypothetical protein